MAEQFGMADYFHRRNRRHLEKRIIPTVLIGGFLGSGKTTLVNQVINLPEQARTDVIVREFGSVSIDHKLMKTDGERIHPSPFAWMHIDEEMLLYESLDRLHDDRFGKFDRLILETSGTESPDFFLHVFMLNDVPDMYRMDCLLTLVDAEYGDLNLNEYDAAVEQVAYADVLVINKIDLTDEKRLASLKRRLRGINAMAPMFCTNYGKVDFDFIKNLSLYQQLRQLPEQAAEEDQVDRIKSLVIEESAALDKTKVNAWINELFDTSGAKILRSKGFFNFYGEDYRYEFQAVRQSFHSYAHDKWNEDERKTVIVLIGEDLPDKARLTESLRNCISTEE